MLRCAIRSITIADVRREEETGVEPLDRLRDVPYEPLSSGEDDPLKHVLGSACVRDGILGTLWHAP